MSERKNRREVILSPHSGFCFGVERAINTALQADSKDCYACGSLIHNKTVIKKLGDRGIKTLNSIDEAPRGSKIIVRSHGEGRKFYEKAKEKDITPIDATCPFVTKIHQIVYEASKDGKKIVIVGDAEHPEVKATCGWVENDEAVVIDDPGQIEEHLPEITGRSLLIVAQTTIKEKTFDDVTQQLSSFTKDIEVKNTICNATFERQKGCLQTAQSVEAMIVVGDKNSSNSRKLFEIAKDNCKNAYFIENINEISLKEMGNYNKIGVAAGASTPADTIKEVILSMSEKTLDQELTMADLMEEVEKGLRLPRSGELVKGTVLQVSDKEIIVNLGCKKDGVIPAAEVSLEEGQELTEAFKEGDEIDAKVLKTDDGEGSILLSRKKLEVGVHWQELEQAEEEKALVEVEVVRQVKGGVIANYKEVSGFIPLSQLSDRYIEDSSDFVGQTMKVKVSRVDMRRSKAIFSHKAYLHEQKQKILEELWEKIHVDDIVEGKVMRFTDYGAFVDIGGIDGLLHISEISWGKLKHPKEVLSVGQVINVKILSMNKENGKISLGLKQTTPEPWSVIDEDYSVGDVVKGKIVQIKEYGCFVELKPGLDGLVHISEVSHRRIANINDVLSVGQEIETKILDIDKDRRRISLSIKETMDPPTEEELAAEAAAREETKKAKEEKAEEAAEEPKAEESAEAPAEAPSEEAAKAEEAEEAPAEESTEAPAENADEE